MTSPRPLTLASSKRILSTSICRIDFFRQSDERVITAFTIQAENKDLVFLIVGGLQQARMNIFARITSVAGRRVGIFEDPVITTATQKNSGSER